MTDATPQPPGSASIASPTLPAGWYPDQTGMQRWWDGQAWGQYAPMAQIVQAVPRNGIAVLSFVLGLVGFLIGWVWVISWALAAGAVVTGIVALRSIDTTRARGKGLAVAGIILGGLTFLFALAVFITAITS